MDSRDMWEYQVELLTKQARELSNKCSDLEMRLDYYESVLGTLLIALKEGGVIVQSDDGEHSFN